MSVSAKKLSKKEAKTALDKYLQTLSLAKDSEARLTAIDSAFQLWNDNSEVGDYLQKDIIQSVAASCIERERQKLLSCLSYQVDGLTAQSITAILECATLPSKEPATLLSMFDRALHGFDERWRFEQVVSVLNAHMPQLPKDFDVHHLCRFFGLVWKDVNRTSLVFSNWLNNGDLLQCSILADAINKQNDDGIQLLLFKKHIPTDANDQIFFARKCIGFLSRREVTAVSLLLSLYKNASKSAQAAIEELLFNPFLLNYSVNLRDYLETQKTNKSKRISGVVLRLLKRQDEYFEGLKTPDELVEFHPSTEQRWAATVKCREYSNRERNKDIQKHAPVFADLMTTESTMLYGRRGFTTTHHGNGQTSSSVVQMQEISFSTEIPRLMIVDPAGFRQMLSMFKFEKRTAR